ncbi:hypothetical protein [Aliarcobacter butzleri]|uniref:hypothetical protein n=1 Tax=Aliarcobacter butzleri TaxID=28197 RepID=UPI003AC4A6AE
MRKIGSHDLEAKLTELNETELLTAFKAIVGCDGKTLDLAIDDKTYGEDRFEIRRKIINFKKDIVIKLAKEFELDYLPLFNNLGIKDIDSHQTLENEILLKWQDIKDFKEYINPKISDYLDIEATDKDGKKVGIIIWTNKFTERQIPWLKNLDRFYSKIFLLTDLSNENQDFREEVFKYAEYYHLGQFIRLNQLNENIIKKTCKDLGLTYAQLAEQIGYGENSVSNASRGEVSKAMQKAIELYLRNLELEKQLEDYEAFKNLVRKAIN